MFKKNIFLGDPQIISPYGIGAQVLCEKILMNVEAYREIETKILGDDFPISKMGIIDRNYIQDSKYLYDSENFLNFLLQNSHVKNKSTIDAVFVLFKNGSAIEYKIDLKDLPMPDLESIARVLKENNICIPDNKIFLIDNTCVTGASLITFAAQGIELGKWKRALLVTIDLIEMREMYSLYMLGALNTKTNGVVMPFDSNRNGFIKSESLSLCIIDSEENNFENGPLSKIHSFSHENEAYRITESNEDALAIIRVMNNAASLGQLKLTDINLIKAHGTGTWINDLVEAKAIKNLFGNSTPVVSLKGHLGHTMDASGLVENLILGYFIKHFKQVPFTKNCSDLIEEIHLIKKDPISSNNIEFYLSNSFGFGGQNLSIVFQRN